MHHCLQIEEVVRRIAFCRDVLTPAQLVRMALTCRAFYEPAMDALWETLKSGMVPLLLLLPARCIGRPGSLGFLKLLQKPEDFEWDRVRHHARRVRFLVAEEDIRNVITLQGDLAEYYPDPYFCPNLRKILIDYRPMFSKIEAFLPPSLQEVQFGSCHDLDLSFLQRIGSLRSLKVLTMYDRTESSFPEQLETVFTESLYRLSRLTTLETGPLRLQPKALAHLATLPDLKNLTFWVGEDLFNSSHLVSSSMGATNPFPSLTRLDLSVSCDNAYGLLGLVNALPKLRLLELSITIGRLETPGRYSGWWPSGKSSGLSPASATYMDRLTELTARITSLKVLKLFVFGLHKEYAGLFFTDDSLSPLLRLNLTRFHAEGCAIRLTPHALRQIVASWPCIQELHLGDDCSWRHVTPFELPDILPLTDCPELHTLGVHLNTSAGLENFRLPGTSKSVLRLMRLRQTEIKDAKGLAMFLHSAFPLARLDKKDISFYTSDHRELNPLLDQLKTRNREAGVPGLVSM